ncbi:MAG: LysM domain-containing protein [Burkholderiaceae bacterium]
MFPRLLPALMLTALVAACAAPPSAPPQPAPPPAPVAPEPPKVEAPPPPPPAPSGPPPGSPAARSQAQQLLRHVAELLNEGQEDKAREELAQALQLDPDNKMGVCLNRGVTVDPVATLGRESTPYTVRPGETLGRIAARALGDACEFYLLARYNQMAVPRQLQAGHVLRIPGRSPLAAPDAPAAPARGTPAEAARPEPSRVEPAKPAEVAAPPAEVSPARRLEAARVRAEVDRHHRIAQSAFRRQDLTTAIREWSAVLDLDPSNDLARARRQEAIDLQERLKRIR